MEKVPNILKHLINILKHLINILKHLLNILPPPDEPLTFSVSTPLPLPQVNIQADHYIFQPVFFFDF